MTHDILQLMASIKEANKALDGVVHQVKKYKSPVILGVVYDVGSAKTIKEIIRYFETK